MKKQEHVELEGGLGGVAEASGFLRVQNIIMNIETIMDVTLCGRKVVVSYVFKPNGDDRLLNGPCGFTFKNKKEASEAFEKIWDVLCVSRL